MASTDVSVNIGDMLSALVVNDLVHRAQDLGDTELLKHMAKCTVALVHIINDKAAAEANGDYKTLEVSLVLGAMDVKVLKEFFT